MLPSTRLRESVATLFDVVCEVGMGVEDGKPAPVILMKYPDDFEEPNFLKSIRTFSFPLGVSQDGAESVQLFSFVLTDSQSKYTFGFCRHTPRNNTCICILSGHPWPSVFFKLLNHLSTVMNNGKPEDLDMFLTQLYHQEIAPVGHKMRYEGLDSKFCIDIEVPDTSRLPTLRDDKYMLEFFNALDHRQMIHVYASLLKERRIIFTGRKLSQLSSCTYAAPTLLYPFNWHQVFIPVVPKAMSDILACPTPFIMGMPKQALEGRDLRDLSEVVVVDIDERKLHSSHDDAHELPAEVLSFLKSQLKSATDMGDGLARAFLRTNVILFGGYRLGFARSPDNTRFIWDREKFLSQQRPSLQPFLGFITDADGVQYKVHRGMIEDLQLGRRL